METGYKPNELWDYINIVQNLITYSTGVNSHVRGEGVR